MLKYMDRVAVHFAPLSPASKSARSFLHRLLTERNRKSNPKCIITPVPADGIGDQPFVEVHYVDKTHLLLPTRSLQEREILREVGRKSNKMALADDIKAAS